MRSPARSMKRRAAPGAAARFRPSGSCRISAIELSAVGVPATTRESQAVAEEANLALIPEGQLMVPSARQSRLSRRAYHLALSALATTAWCIAGTAPSTAQDPAAFYRGKTMRIVVGFSSGGGYDVYARVLARHIGRYIPGNPTVVVQNMPGAASLKSVQFLTTGAPADGTLITTFNPGLITQSLTAPDKVGNVNFLDYAWVGKVSDDFRVCYTWNGTGIKNFQELLARPRVNFGNTGVGTSAYIDNRILSELFGVKLNMVKGYPGSADKRIA